MQLLIVHHDAEMGGGLLRIAQEYAGQPADYVPNDDAAWAWAESGRECDLLLAQLEAPGIDGLTLSGSLGAKFPRLQTFFLPAYAANEQRLEVANTKVFPEPIDGERLLQAIARAGEGDEAERSFHLVDMLQMCCLGRKSGALQLAAGTEKGVVFLREGELLHAATASAAGREALYEMLCWGPVVFGYDAQASAVERTIDLPWDEALTEIVLRKRAQPSPAPEEEAAAPLPNELDLTGQVFGTYRVGRKLSETFWDKLYTAEQTSIGRPVVLHVLRDSLRQDPARAQEFLDTASVNANIRHPAILPVYEAGEHEGRYYYAREFVVGRTLLEITSSGLTISALLALRVIRAVAEAMAHLEDHQILHAPLQLSRIFVTPNEEARLAEVAVINPALAQHEPAESEIKMLGRLLIPVTKATATPGSGRVLKLIHQMQTSGDDALTEWDSLADEAKLLETLVAPSPLVSPKKTGLLDKVKFWGK